MPCPLIGPKSFLTVQIVFGMYELLWMGPIFFGQEYKKLLKCNLDLFKLIWTRPILILSVQSYLQGPKSFWTDRRKRHKNLATL